WLAAGALTALSMALRFRWFGVGEGAAVVGATAVAGAAAAAAMFFAVKRDLEAARSALATEIASPELRGSLVKPISLRVKLVGCAVATSALPLLIAFALFFAEVRAGADAFALRWQGRVLDSLIARLEGRSFEAARALALGDEAALAAPLELTRLDLATARDAAHAALDPRIVERVREQRDAGADRGSGSSALLGRAFSWRSLGDGTLVVASLPRNVAPLALANIGAPAAVLLVAAIAIAGLLAWLASSDVTRGLHQLRAQVARLAAGDLRREQLTESEDEVGDLARGIEAMSDSLRGSLSQIFGAVDRFEATVGDIASISGGVAAVTADQVSGIQRAALYMEAIDEQVRGIADSAGVLSGSVEESSSSILELGAAGNDLNETATTLSETVEEVTTSMEQIVRSVSQVVKSTRALSDAATETSTSMELMANSLLEVDESAEESARLSTYVVSTAELGREKVRQTINGMDAIRSATETAEQVIRNLGGRTKEIGAIVDVIDDVADETNLLALNAAIIAAQAGEHGRAFSVVADEIKDLADRVLASTKEIGGLIRAVQEEGANAIGAIETGTESVASGVDLSAEAGISLEEITRASRDSGQRIEGILKAVRAQARAASHVVELMERVRGGVEEIRTAATEQERGNTVVYRNTTAMRDVAKQVRGTTEEQARGSSRIRESVEGQRDAVEQINRALQEQTAACRSAVEFIEEIFAQTRANEESARRMDSATKGLLAQSAALRDAVHRLRL
ncbi:MAG TPA: HAMP domain-containing methyl-accepting chemotaxis protein, partial [Myxococcota bacterium]|nr:HAMP domain-containing methyl-accepting chemotaxis protein [Myxococcota bacterium]